MAAAKQMRVSADLQDKVGQGEVDIPAREMLADILLESGHAKEALVEYKQALKLSPNRFNGLFNAGKAAEAGGSPGEARGYYASLLKATDNGVRSNRFEIQHAKDFVATANNGGARQGSYWAVSPPSTRSAWPTMNEASSEARNNTARAISAGSAIRPIGVAADAVRSTSGSLNHSASIAVFVPPGQMALMRIPSLM